MAYSNFNGFNFRGYFVDLPEHLANDPSEDIIKILDEVGLNGAAFLSGNESMSAIVSRVRMRLISRLKDYIQERDSNVR